MCKLHFQLNLPDFWLVSMSRLKLVVQSNKKGHLGPWHLGPNLNFFILDEIALGKDVSYVSKTQLKFAAGKLISSNHI